MASGLSAGSDAALVTNILGLAAGNFAVPSVCGISLHSAALGNAKVIASEWVNGGAANTSYTSRLSAGIVNWTVAAFVSGTGSVGSNTALLSFVALTGTGNTLLSVGFNTSLTIGAGLLTWFADVTSVTIATGITVAFFIGDITFTLL